MPAPTSVKAAGTGEQFRFQVDDVPQTAGYTWFRGEHCNYNPQIENLRSGGDVARHVLAGWLPREGTERIGPRTRISAFGSCFAQHISEWLARRDYSVLTHKEGKHQNVYVVRFGEGIVNTFAIRQQFEWAFENKRFEGELWHGYDATAFGYDETIRAETRAIFDQTDLFIITLGLSEVWYDEVSGGVFWRAVPREKFDPSRHKFRVATVQQNKENIRAIYDLIAKHRPSAKMIFTLSPIPLVATFRPVSCITANFASKAILRASLDEVLREVHDEARAFYWPAFEIVLDVFDNRWTADRRHVRSEILDFVMTLFETHWCEGTPRLSLEEAWTRARIATLPLPQSLKKNLGTLAGWWVRMRGSRSTSAKQLRD